MKPEELLRSLQPGTRGRILLLCYWLIAKKDERPLEFENPPMIPLNDAVLCQNCSVISPARNHHCPACQASGAWLVGLAQKFKWEKVEESVTMLSEVYENVT